MAWYDLIPRRRRRPFPFGTFNRRFFSQAPPTLLLSVVTDAGDPSQRVNWTFDREIADISMVEADQFGIDGFSVVDIEEIDSNSGIVSVNYDDAVNSGSAYVLGHCGLIFRDGSTAPAGQSGTVAAQ